MPIHPREIDVQIRGFFYSGPWQERVTMLIYAIISMISALIFYSIGVWGEKFSGRLSPVNIVFFWIGFTFDTTGTALMGIISGRFKADIHGITGLLAIILMLIHALWATMVLIRKQEKMIHRFHKFSIIVWLIWLIPFGTGVVLNSF